MEAKQLVSSDQIKQLYDFTRSHFVEYYDLQTELVDHLANAIEQQWIQNPQLSFDQALKIEFSKFGVFGFMDVVAAREAAMRKKYDRIIFSIFKQFFQIPNILLIIAAFAVVFLVIKLVPNAWIGIVILYGIFIIIVPVKAYHRRRLASKKGEKTWLFKTIINSYGSSSILFMIFFYGIFHTSRFLPDLDYTNNLTTTVLSAVVVAFGVFSYIVLHYIPSKAESYLDEVYPEFKMLSEL